MSERSLLLASLRFAADSLFEQSNNYDGCRALFLLGQLLDRRTITNAEMSDIRGLARMARGIQEEWR